MNIVIIIIIAFVIIGAIIGTMTNGDKEGAIAGALSGLAMSGGCLYQLLILGISLFVIIWLFNAIFG